MAGNYPDAPSYRLAYDRDGTQMYKISPTNVITQLTTANMATLNDEDDDSVDIQPTANGGTGMLVFYFPQVTDLDGYRMTHNIQPYEPPPSIVAETSINTTNGLDGTWVAYATWTPIIDETAKPAYRTVSSATALGIKAVRFKGTPVTSDRFAPSTVHLYGEPSPGANPDRLDMWHPTLDEKLPPAYFDWGDTPRSSSADRTFRVKNVSSTITANTIRVAMEVATDSTPSLPGQHLLSYNGGTFAAQITIGDLAPGAISQPVTLRRVIASNAQLSLWTMRVFAAADSWA